MNLFQPRIALTTAIIGVLLMAIFGTTVVWFRGELLRDIHQTIIDRDAAVLSPVAEAQLRDAEANPSNQAFGSEMLLPSVMKTVRGMLGVAIYDAEGNLLQTSPASLAPTELAPDEYARLASGARISRYDPQFPLEQAFPAENPAGERRTMPMLQVLLPLQAVDSEHPVGFVKYYIDAKRLEEELTLIDRRLNRQTAQTLGVGGLLIAVVLAGAYVGLSRAQRIIAERNERLTRANFELTLAAKTSALGVITSHLIHGLQGPVAGLRAVVADHALGGKPSQPEWESAASYTERMQNMIHETVALLGDAATQTTYELGGDDLAATIHERNDAAAIAKGVVLSVETTFPGVIDSHRGSLVCLITTNLVQNAIEATDPGRHVRVSLHNADGGLTVTVADEGHGIPLAVREHLFEPGRTGRVGGTGLGLAISQLLARQIAGTLALVDSSPKGTTFRLTVPEPAKNV